MSDENRVKILQDTDHRGTPAQMVYESNPKHCDPWQIGKKGSLCEAEVRPLASQLLEESVLWEGKRYAIHQGKAYCAQEHEPNRWHGYPIGWLEVPFLQCLVSNWDFFLHEERLPTKNAGGTAWISMRRTNEAPPHLSPDEAERWETRWHPSWKRHCWVACREGGLLVSARHDRSESG